MYSRSSYNRFYDGKTPIYPAITVPIDGKYEYNCPPELLEETKKFLIDCHNYLIIGTSGNDQDLLDLLKQNASNGNIMFVSRYQPSLVKCKKNFLDNVKKFGTGPINECADGLTRFIESGAFDVFLNHLIN